MIKSVFAATAALSLSAGAAVAGPYVNVETNAGWAAEDYTGATTDIHVGYEGALGDYCVLLRSGVPAVVAVDGEDAETEFSGKAGIGVEVTEAFGVYGEVSFITTEIDGDDELGVGGKLGVKYAF